MSHQILGCILYLKRKRSVDVNVSNSRTNHIENNQIKMFVMEIKLNGGSSESFQPYLSVV